MKKYFLAAVCAAAFLPSVSHGFALLPPASSASAVLTFEGVGNYAAVDSYYDGGTDSAGNSGTNYGITFSSASLGLIDSDVGGSGNFANAPSGRTVLFFISGAADTLNYAAGFSNGFSFYYSSAAAASVRVYSGLNGTGNVLATLSLPSNYANGNCGGDPTGTYCHWDPVGVTFAGIAQSVDFGGSANNVAFDDITIGSAVAGTVTTAAVPEPASVLLMGLGLTALLATRRKRRA